MIKYLQKRGRMEEFSLEKEFEILIRNGWLTESEAEQFIGDENIKKCLNECTSPTKDKVFRALKEVPLDRVRVLILGKDPYPNPKDAHGLAFSSDNLKTPDSLKNIFKAIDKAYGSNLFEKAQNNLTNWVNEGVLLLNTGLTYSKVCDETITKKELNSLQTRTQSRHMRTWKNFVKLIMQKILSIKEQPIVMMLWGNEAHDIVFSNINDKSFQEFVHVREAVIIPDTKIMLLQTSHPSPLSVNRGGDFPTTAPIHFKECDKHLGCNKIHWIKL